MKLLQLTATFGCLQGDTLEFGPGMTLIGAPNGSGKSTWCAFLRTMLYGLDTRAGSWSSAGPPPAGCPWGIFPRSTRTPAWPCPA